MSSSAAVRSLHSLPRPPATAAWLLSRRVPAALRDFILGDLEEEFRDRHAVSPADARRWCWRQTIRCLAAPPPRRRPPRNIPTHAFSSAFSHRTGDSLMRTVLADVRLALRVFVRTPGFAFAAIGVLALGIGANTAIFSLVNTVLLRPLPFAEPDGIVRVFHVPPQAAFPNTPRFPLSPANFYDWQAAAKKFEGMAMYRFREFVLTGQGEAATVTAGALDAGFLRIIRVQPALGRDFLPEEDEPGRSRVVILSDRFLADQPRRPHQRDRRTADAQRHAVLHRRRDAAILHGARVADRQSRGLRAAGAVGGRIARCVRNHNLQAIARLEARRRRDAGDRRTRGDRPPPRTGIPEGKRRLGRHRRHTCAT